MSKKKLVALTVGMGVLIVGIFGITYTIRSGSIEKETKMTEELVEEVDGYKVESFKIKYKDKEYTKLEELKDIEAGTVVDCTLNLANKDKKNVKGYVKKGDTNHIEFDGTTARITLQKK